MRTRKIMERCLTLTERKALANHLHDIANEYNAKRGQAPVKTNEVEVDSRRDNISKAYDRMKHDPTHPKVKAAYAAMKSDVKSQWNHLSSHGYTMSLHKDDPYKDHHEMLKDIHDNKHIKVWSHNGDMPADHPLNGHDPETGIHHNSMFRAVHDVFGHGISSHDFTERGEENALHHHSQMFSKEAMPAVTTDTKGQSSVYGHRHDQGKKKLFPKQKAGILPSKFHSNVNESTEWWSEFEQVDTDRQQESRMSNKGSRDSVKKMSDLLILTEKKLVRKEGNITETVVLNEGMCQGGKSPRAGGGAMSGKCWNYASVVSKGRSICKDCDTSEKALKAQLAKEAKGQTEGLEEGIGDDHQPTQDDASRTGLGRLAAAMQPSFSIDAGGHNGRESNGMATLATAGAAEIPVHGTNPGTRSEGEEQSGVVVVREQANNAPKRFVFKENKKSTQNEEEVEESFKDTHAAIKAMGLHARKTWKDSGDPNEIRVAFGPGPEHEDSAYYTNDHDDAVGTAKHMAAARKKNESTVSTEVCHNCGSKASKGKYCSKECKEAEEAEKATETSDKKTEAIAEPKPDHGETAMGTQDPMGKDEPVHDQPRQVTYQNAMVTPADRKGSYDPNFFKVASDTDLVKEYREGLVQDVKEAFGEEATDRDAFMSLVQNGFSIEEAYDVVFADIDEVSLTPATREEIIEALKRRIQRTGMASARSRAFRESTDESRSHTCDNCGGSGASHKKPGNDCKSYDPKSAKRYNHPFEREERDMMKVKFKSKNESSVNEAEQTHKLVHKSGKELKAGDKVKDFRGESHTIKSWIAPHRGSLQVEEGADHRATAKAKAKQMGHKLGNFSHVMQNLSIAQCKDCRKNIHVDTAKDAIQMALGPIGGQAAIEKCSGKK